ncbi:uncharacterized protein BYT42DRAFT_611611 [Radiomyces spectabilis]|uniref:uncharacterized protein n=1 Tax=Radiomyces spectabilis TaxID=64574 RepID=UPI002220D30C|nr:uncharacterized protein BYT42DRAFT_611611 [Radiomyces spectabilis]KAI8388585.1 hypothetical protein BYT42DRAFT_611611 [Radiomyces spectabilis]
MKRASDYVGSNGNDINKKPRFTQQSYGDSYGQYGTMNPTTAAMMMAPQYATSAPFSGQANAGTSAFPGMTPFGAVNGSVYNAGMANYNGAQYASMTPTAGMTGVYPPTAFGASPFLGAGAGMPGTSAGNELSRTIYLGNVTSDISATEILNQVKTGPVESIRILPEKSCAFLAFVDTGSAQAFYQEHLSRKMTVNGTDLKVGWGKYNPLPSAIQLAVQAGASRNVYLGHLDDNITETQLQENLSRFGQIDQVKLIREKRIAFVHFLSIASAMKCVTTLPTESAWAGKRVNYGKDRCAYIPKAGGTDPSGSYGMGFQSPFQGAFTFDAYSGSGSNVNPASAMVSSAYGMQAGNMMATTPMLRTLYLGNVSPDATCEDLCNVIRGGLLFQIRYLQDKHIAFVTFMDPSAAVNVYNQANCNGLVVKNRRLKVGWGKPSLIPANVWVSVQSGASRNIYIGGVEDSMTEEKLREEFSQFGEIELVNMLKEKNCAFVNFTNILNAMKALTAIKSNPAYAKYKLNYGKDRCANPPRRPPNGQQSHQHQHQQPQQPQQQQPTQADSSSTDGYVTLDDLHETDDH